MTRKRQVTTRAALRPMYKQKSGSIIYMGCLEGGICTQSSLCHGKTRTDRFSEGVAKEGGAPGAARRTRRSVGYICNQPPEFVVACASQSTGRGGSSRRLLSRRWRRSRGCSRSRHGRGGSRSRAWFTATVHHAHFSSAALADRGTHRGVPYTDAIDQLTPQAKIQGGLLRD
jgi:hypothetical protein